MDPFASSFSEHDDGEADVYMSKEEIIEELALQKTFLASLEDMPDGDEKAEQQRGYQKEIDTLNQRLRKMNAVERSSSASNRAGGGLGGGQRYGSLASTQRASDPFADPFSSDFTDSITRRPSSISNTNTSRQRDLVDRSRQTTMSSLPDSQRTKRPRVDSTAGGHDFSSFKSRRVEDKKDSLSTAFEDEVYDFDLDTFLKQEQIKAEKDAKQQYDDERFARSLANEYDSSSAAPRPSQPSSTSLAASRPSQPASNTPSFDAFQIMTGVRSRQNLALDTPTDSTSTTPAEPVSDHSFSTHHPAASANMPGAFPDTPSSDSELEIIDSSAFHDNGRHPNRQSLGSNTLYRTAPPTYGPSANLYHRTTQPNMTLGQNGFVPNRIPPYSTHLPGLHGSQIPGWVTPNHLGAADNALGGLPSLISAQNPYISPFGSGALHNSNMGNSMTLPAFAQTFGQLAQQYGDTLGYDKTNDLHNYIHDPNRTKDDIKNLLENIRPDMDIPVGDRDNQPEQLTCTLQKHQKIALAWMKTMEESRSKGGILADDMGLGKTISSLALLLCRPSEDRRCKTTLIVGPVALIGQWEKEIKRRTRPSLSVYTYHAQRKAMFNHMKDFDVVLTTFGTLGAEYKRYDELQAKLKQTPDMDTSVYELKMPLLGKNSMWYRVILDEAQCIKNKNTKAAMGASYLKATYRWCLTGTPMMNGVHELYSLIHFLRIRPYNDYTRFNQTFKCLTKGTGPERHLKAAMKKLQTVLKAILLRRTKTSEIDGEPILKSLPSKTEEVVHAVFDEDEDAFYKALEGKSRLQFNKYLKAGTVGKNYSNILVLLLRLRQAACHPHLIMDYEEAPTEASPDQMMDLARSLAEDVVKRLKEAEIPFECPICYDPISNPSLIVPCGHDTCANCLVRLTSDVTGAIAHGHDTTTAKCPTCRGPVDTKKVIDFETFRKVFLPDPADAVKEEDEDDDASDSDSDSDSEMASDAEDDLEVNRHGDIRGFIVPDGAGSEYDSDEEDDDLEAEPARVKKEKGKAKVKKEEVFGDEEVEDDDDLDAEPVRVKQEKGKGKVKMEDPLDDGDEDDLEADPSSLTVKREVGSKVKAEGSKDVKSSAITDEVDSDDELPDLQLITAAPSKSKAGASKMFGATATSSAPRTKFTAQTAADFKRREKKKKDKKAKKSKGEKKDKKDETQHIKLSQLKKEAMRSAEGRKRYMRYLRKNWVSSGKVDKCLELLRATPPDVKTIIFSQFTTLLDLLEIPIHREKMGYGRYDGGMTSKNRQASLERFDVDPRCRVLLVSLKAGNAGLNLTAASQVIILDPFWNPYIEMQAIDRAHRMGQTRPVVVHRILVKGTVEDRIIELQERKRKLVDAALDEKVSRGLGRLRHEDLVYLFDAGEERETVARRNPLPQVEGLGEHPDWDLPVANPEPYSGAADTLYGARARPAWPYAGPSRIGGINGRGFERNVYSDTESDFTDATASSPDSE